MSTIILQGYVTSNLTVSVGFTGNEDTPPAPPAEDPTIYTVTITEASNGATSQQAGDYLYTENDTLTITAVPDSGYRFDYWTTSTGVLLGSTQTLTITSDLILTPVFDALPVQGDTAHTLTNLWTNMLTKIQAQGVNTAATLHALELGEQDSITGTPGKYWQNIACDMIITPEGVELQQFGTGNYNKLSAKGFTNTNVSDGDEVTDSFGNTWAITHVIPYKIGGFKECTLNLQLASNFTHPATPSYLKNLTILVVDAILDTYFPYTFTFNLA